MGPWTPRAALCFDVLRRYVRRKGHARVPYDHREGNIRLGVWVWQRRHDHRAGILTSEQVRLLEALPGWTWDPLRDQFAKALAAVEAFARREGHTRVPPGHIEEGVRLHYWAQNRRKDRRKGILSRDRIRALERVPHWTWSVREARFEEGFAHLLRFAKREGHARVPVDHIENAFPLGAWVHKQRGRRSQMPPARARRLERLRGWVWNAFEAGFEKGLLMLRRYATREGHACPPARHVEKGFPLGSWVSHLRSRRLGLSRAARHALEVLPGWKWTVRRPRRRRSARSQ